MEVDDVRRGEVVEVDAQRLAVKVGVVVVGHEEDEAEHVRGRLRWRRRRRQRAVHVPLPHERAVVAVRGVRAELGLVAHGVTRV